MDYTVKKGSTITGKFKMLNVNGGVFVDEDGTIVPIADIIESAMEGRTFDLTATSKVEEEVDLEGACED